MKIALLYTGEYQENPLRKTYRQVVKDPPPPHAMPFVDEFGNYKWYIIQQLIFVDGERKWVDV